MLKFNVNDHRFFNHLISYLGAISGLAIIIDIQRNVPIISLNANVICIRGKKAVTNIELKFSPYSIFKPILENSWPVSIELIENPLDTNKLKVPLKIKGTNKFHRFHIQYSFIHYFEMVQPLIKSKYGSVPNWPPVLQFGRVIRNAFAHNGLNMTDPRVKIVSWRGLSYSHKDNGRDILYTDITPVEIIYLWKEMDEVI